MRILIQPSVVGVLWFIISLAWPAHAQLVDFRYNFEEQPHFELWSSNGSYKIHRFTTVDATDPARGKVLSIDLELVTARYVYFAIPTQVPLDGSLILEGDIRVLNTRNAAVALGANIALSPVRRTGVYKLSPISTPTDWVTHKTDIGLASREKATKLVDTYFYGAQVDDVGVWLDRIGLFIEGQPGARISLQVDRVLLDGHTPDPVGYERLKQTAWSNAGKRIQKRLLKYTVPVLKIRDGDDSQNEDRFNFLRAATDEILKRFRIDGYISPQDQRHLRYYAKSIKYLKPTSDRIIATYPWPPTSEFALLPTTDPIPSAEGDTLRIAACRGEIEPASFVLRSTQSLTGITIDLDDLSTLDGHRISSEVVDLHLVKCWFQAGAEDVRQRKEKTLVPELLVKDNDLVRVDLLSKTNLLRVHLNGIDRYLDMTSGEARIPEGGVIRDADKLRPFDLRADFNQQMWLTIRVPEDATPGVYRGYLRIAAQNRPLARLNLELEILPFVLPPPPLDYAIYYRGKVTSDAVATIGSEYKSAGQYALEMADLRAHGISHPTLYQQNDRYLETALNIRSQVGFHHGPLYVLALQTRVADFIGHLDVLTSKVKRWVSIAKARGYSDTYIYGEDEARDNLIADQLPLWQAVHQSGAKVFVACPAHADLVSGNALDLGILNGPLKPAAARRWTLSGGRVFSYGNPQIGVEDPAIYRLNYGFRLWLSGYHGAMNYAYQHAMGEIWNDFDHPKHRDHVFSYPLTQGLVGTVAWEGFREAVDDTRYLSASLAGGRLTAVELRQRLTTAIANETPAAEIRTELIEVLRSLEEGSLR
ncbi:MAG: hypothetical protein QNJ22_23525 [Desulfosarcinaceae bacterium]|nr:hypothetical protein [Desulfosarcinaceae bacterium]